MIKIQQKYENYFFHGEWHLHTNYTDGANSVLEYCNLANDLEIPLIAFTEHVRLNMEYDYFNLLHDIRLAREKYPNLILLAGVETKILPNGTLDCHQKILQLVDYISVAFHSFPEDVKVYFYSIKSVLRKYQIDSWAHPGLFFKKNVNLELSDDELSEIFTIMKEKKIMIEVNLKYKLPTLPWIKKYRHITKGGIVYGSDVHTLDDLRATWKIKQEWKRYNFNKKIQGDKDIEFMIWLSKNFTDNLDNIVGKSSFHDTFR